MICGCDIVHDQQVNEARDTWGESSDLHSSSVQFSSLEICGLVGIVSWESEIEGLLMIVTRSKCIGRVRWKNWNSKSEIGADFPDFEGQSQRPSVAC